MVTYEKQVVCYLEAICIMKACKINCIQNPVEEKETSSQRGVAANLCFRLYGAHEQVPTVVDSLASG